MADNIKFHTKTYKRYPAKLIRELDRRFREGELKYKVASFDKLTIVTWVTYD